jgi:hypothetical protein
MDDRNGTRFIDYILNAAKDPAVADAALATGCGWQLLDELMHKASGQTRVLRTRTAH